ASEQNFICTISFENSRRQSRQKPLRGCDPGCLFGGELFLVLEIVQDGEDALVSLARLIADLAEAVEAEHEIDLPDCVAGIGRRIVLDDEEARAELRARVVDQAERLQRRGDAIMAEANVALGNDVAWIDADNPLADRETPAENVERILMAALGHEDVADP